MATRKRKKAPRKAAGSRTKSRRGRSKGRWYDSNWFLLLIAVMVIAGIRFYRSQQGDDSPPGTAAAPPQAVTEGGEIAEPEGETPAPERQLAELATIAVVTGAPGGTAGGQPIAVGRDTAVLEQPLQPEELPELGSPTPAVDDLAAEVTGAITYRGLLHDEVIVPTTDRHACDEHAAGALRVTDGHLADVLVWVDTGGDAAVSEAGIEVTGCRIGPRSSTLRTGGALTFTSNDDVEHRIIATASTGDERLLAVLSPGGEPVGVTMEESGLSRLSCEHHAWEEAFLLVTDHPHASVSDVDGRFDLGPIPLPESGLIPLRLFHPTLGTFEQAVQLEGPLQLDIDLTERAL